MAQGLKLKSDSMTIHEAEKLAQDYCGLFGITFQELKSKKKKNKSRVVRGIHVDYMRMCLAHFFGGHRMMLKQIAALSGYSNHTTVIQNRDRTREYVESRDPYLYPYWESLMGLVENTYEHLKEVA